MQHQEINEKLRQRLKFTKDDLNINKQGILSAAQIETVKTLSYFNKSKSNKLIIGIAAGGMLLAIAKGAGEGLSTIAIICMVAFIGIAYLLYILYNNYKHKKLEEGKIKVEVLQGKVTLFYDNTTANNPYKGQYGGIVSSANEFAGIKPSDYAYVVQIGKKKIYTTKDIYEAFENDKVYNVYFIRPYKSEYKNIIISAVIVSAEVSSSSLY